MESESPLPSDINTSELGSRYIFVPHGVKIGEQNPVIVATVVYDTKEEELIAYRYSANYGWKRLSEVTVSSDEIRSSFTLEQIFKSVIGYTGSNWNSVHAMILHLDSSFDQSLLEETELQLLAQSVDRQKNHSSCNTDTDAHLFYEYGSKSVELQICNSCGKLMQIYVENNGTLETHITDLDSYTSLTNVKISPDKITELAGGNDQFLITDQQAEPNDFILRSIPFWWQSQLQTALSQQYLPTQMNTTLCCKGEEIVGAIIWSFVFNDPTVLHYQFSKTVTEDERIEYLQSFSENLSGTTYLSVPYHNQPDIFTPLYLITGSIEFQSPSNSNGK